MQINKLLFELRRPYGIASFKSINWEKSMCIYKIYLNKLTRNTQRKYLLSLFKKLHTQILILYKILIKHIHIHTYIYLFQHYFIRGNFLRFRF